MKTITPYGQVAREPTLNVPNPPCCNVAGRICPKCRAMVKFREIQPIANVRTKQPIARTLVLNTPTRMACGCPSQERCVCNVKKNKKPQRYCILQGVKIPVHETGQRQPVVNRSEQPPAESLLVSPTMEELLTNSRFLYNAQQDPGRLDLGGGSPSAPLYSRLGGDQYDQFPERKFDRQRDLGGAADLTRSLDRAGAQPQSSGWGPAAGTDAAEQYRGLQLGDSEVHLQGIDDEDETPEEKTRRVFGLNSAGSSLLVAPNITELVAEERRAELAQLQRRRGQ